MIELFTNICGINYCCAELYSGYKTQIVFSIS